MLFHDNTLYSEYLESLYLDERPVPVLGIGDESLVGSGHTHVLPTILHSDKNENYYPLINRIISSNLIHNTEHFLLVNLSKIVNQYKNWCLNLPQVTPYYAIKSNSDTTIIRLLNELGCRFDVASKKEIELVLECGVTPDKMVYANPCKSPKYIDHAKKVGVNLLVVDCICELEKISRYYPEADLLMRIKVDDSHSLCKFNSKYGVDFDEIDGIFKRGVELGSRICGVSFHVGSSCKNKNVFDEAIQNCKHVIDMGRLFGFDMKIVDIGGGFLSEIGETADVINGAIDKYFFSVEYKDVKFIAEPGRYFSSNSHTLVTSIINIKSKIDEKTGEKIMIYYLTDGVYGVFSGAMFDYAEFEFEVLCGDEQHKGRECSPLFKSILFGPTCDSIDVISKKVELPILNLGDRLIIRNIGAYSVASAMEFNGFPIPEKIYFYV